MHDDAKAFISSQKPDAAAPLVRYRRSRRPQMGWWLAAADVLGLGVSWLLSFGVLWVSSGPVWRGGLAAWWAQLGGSRIAVFAGLLAIMLVLFGMRGHYSKRWPVADEVLDIGKVFLTIAVLDAVLSYLAKWHLSRSWFIAAWVLAVLTVPLMRLATKYALMRARLWQRPTVILGVGTNAREAAAALKSEPLMGLDVVAFLAPPGEGHPASSMEVRDRQLPVVPLDDDPLKTLDRFGSPQVMVALEAERLFAHERLVQQLSARLSDIAIIPPLKGLPLYGMEVTHFFSHEVLMLTVRNNLARPVPQFVKRVFDVIGSALLLLLLSPLFAYLSWRIRQSGGDAIYGHERIGRYGRRFRCLKFRTMVPDADRTLAELLARDPQAREEWERDFKLKNDPRITPIGAFLRRTSLDELPQLWNVLKGEMSLVGPRPVVQEELARYGDQVGYYLEARPGITGLWQISGRNDTGYEDRVALDSWYVRNWSLWYDFVVLVKTVRVVLKQDGAY